MTYSITTKEGKYCVIDANGVEQMSYVHQEQFAKECLRKLEEAEAAKPKPKRARKSNGKLKADDLSTPDVNEAWEGGKAPAKKKKAPAKKKKATKKK